MLRGRYRGRWAPAVRRSPQQHPQYPFDMRFTKAHGTGNDFVVLPDWDGRLELTAPLVTALCDRRRGVGADGVLRVVRGRDGADVFMDYRNADGSLAELCGNGLRVVARHVIDHGLVRPRDGRLRIGTRAGVKEVTVHRAADDRVAEITVELGVPSLDPHDVPFDASGREAVDLPLTVGVDRVRLTVIGLGNPHAVVLVDDVDGVPVTTLGPAIEHHPSFPERTNVEFVQVRGRDTARVRVWERGVGETPACGSGACAVLIALRRLGLSGDTATIHFPGGDLHVRYAPHEHPSVFLTGEAVEVAQGELARDWVNTVAAAA